MALRLIHRIQNERALRRERVMRDRTNPLDLYSDSEVFDRFRFDRETIFEIVDNLAPQLRHPTDRNGALSPTLQVLIALRFYATGAFQNLVGDMVNIHRTTACRAIRRVSLALNRIMGRYVHLPTLDEAARTKQDFFHKSGLRGVIGCIDGTHVRIIGPSENLYLYVNCKGFHSINTQLACNSEMLIFDVVAKWPGSTHDARILRESALHRAFEEDAVSGLLLGDSGYPLKRWLMTPVIAPRTAQDRMYNFKHSSTRSTIERCIGVLKRRFHCLHTELRMRPERACVVIAATVVLHNISILKKLPLPQQVDVPGFYDKAENPLAVNQEDISGRLVRNHLIANL